MPLVDMKDMLHHAYRNRYAVGAFDLVSLDFLEAILRSCEGTDAPVILSLAESHFEHFDFDLMMAATERAARRAEIPVAIHLDHGTSFESAVRAINRGCNGVMVDASHLSFADNVALTRRVTEMAHTCGITVEGELGYVAGVEGEDAEKHPGEVVYTSVQEARSYVEQTGVDCLAVSIGTVHGRMRGRPELDFDRLAQIDASLGIPLVIHGGTGLSEEQYRRLIENGVTKINYYTALSDAAAGAIRAVAARDSGAGYTGLLADARNAIQVEVERMSHLFGSAGQAQGVLASARPWRPVAHLILYDADGLDEAGVEAMMAQGREVLSAIPGVRRVAAGRAVKADVPYHWCWVIEFASEKVIDSYRDHPDHVAFADGLFRPIARERLSIDYELRERCEKRKASPGEGRS
jgi:fructose-bisphosphate aldolase class II